MSTEIKPKLTFEIDCSIELFNKLLEEYSDFDKQHLNPRFAMNCAITSWHLTDWTYQEFYKKDLSFQDSENKDKKGCLKFISGLLKYQQYIIKRCPELEYMRLITNGIKHCVLYDQRRNERIVMYQGGYSHDYSRHDYDVPRFVLEIDKGQTMDFENILIKTMDFWKLILHENENKR